MLRYFNTKMRKVQEDRLYRDLLLAVVVQAVHDYDHLVRAGAIVDSKPVPSCWDGIKSNRILADYKDPFSVIMLLDFLKGQDIDILLTHGCSQPAGYERINGTRIRRHRGISTNK